MTTIEPRTALDGSLSFRIHDPDRSYRDHPVRKAGPDKPIKFAVGAPGHRSGLWRIWSPKKFDDVYVKPMSEEGFAKVSLHATGDWRLQIVDERTSDPKLHWVKKPDPNSRVIDAWHRPPAKDGWTHGLVLFIPSEEIVPVPNDPVVRKDVRRWISPPPEGECAEINVYLVDPSAPRCKFPSDRLAVGAVVVLGAYQLSGGEIVLVTYNRTKLTPQENLTIATVKLAHHLPTDFNINPSTGPRRVLSSSYEDGLRLLVDTAVTQPLRPALDEQGQALSDRY